jgi:phosphoglycerate dehydrogenase-like enzyme
MNGAKDRPTVVLLGSTACKNEARLRRLLHTDWRIVTLREEKDGAALSAALSEADALIALRWQAEWRGMTRRLRLIQSLGAGVDAYDLASLPARCALCNVFEHAVSVAEYVMGALVELTIKLGRRDRLLRAGIWDGSGRHDGEPHEELAGRTLGLLGFGTIGREIARRAAAFDLKVCAIRANPSNSRPDPNVAWVGGPDQLRRLLAMSDYLVVCCPLTSKTRLLLNAETLGWLPPGARIINVARAEIIEEEALYAALKSGRLAGAALDVWYRYPANLQEPLLPASAPFHELENVLMTPHLSAWTHAMIERRWARMAANLDALSDERPLQNIVTQA